MKLYALIALLGASAAGSIDLEANLPTDVTAEAEMNAQIDSSSQQGAAEGAEKVVTATAYLSKAQGLLTNLVKEAQKEEKGSYKERIAKLRKNIAESTAEINAL